MAVVPRVLLTIFAVYLVIVNTEAHVQKNDYFKCLFNSVKSYSDWAQAFNKCSSGIKSWYRISDHAYPTDYVLSIKSNIYLNNTAKFYFSGTVVIRLKMQTTALFIVLHSAPNLKFDYSKIKILDPVLNKTIPMGTINYVPNKKWLFIVVKTPLKKGKLYDVISPEFKSKFLEDKFGFYLQSYWNGKKTKYVASTLLSPFYAKKVFPCLDDPIFQSRIQLNMVRHADWRTQSIMEVKQTKPVPELGSDWMVDIYKPTPQMQIYEFTFAINQFKSLSLNTTSGVNIFIWGPPSELNYTKISLGYIKKAIEFYENYFHNKYPFKKLDVTLVVNMPAYETGSSTYGLLLLVDKIVCIEPTTLPRSKQTFRNIMDHEIAHQWVGNNFKMEWFDSLWLIEGLAGYMEQKIRITQETLQQQLATALRQTLTGLYVDDTAISHPLSSYPHNSKDVEYYFDDLIFLKGFSMIKMLERIMGHKNFRNVLSVVMNMKNKKPMKADDLWTIMDNVLQKTDYFANNKNPTISKLMKIWENQAGYPIVIVKRTHPRTFKLQQIANKPKNNRLKWIIPITYTTQNLENMMDHKSVQWLTERSQEYTLKSRLPLSHWFLLNPTQSAFIRVGYEEKNWMNIIGQLKKNHKKIPPLARLQLIDDCYFFFRNGYSANPEIIIRLLSYLTQEEDMIIWRLVKTIFHTFYSVIYESPLRKKFEKKILKLVNNIYSKIKWKMDNTTRDYNLDIKDSLAAEIACVFGSEDCLKKANLVLKDLVKKQKFEIIHPHLYYPLLCASIRNVTDDIYDKLLKMVNDDNLPDYEQVFVLSRALACTRNEKQFKKFWDYLVKWKDTENSQKANWYFFSLMHLAENLETSSFFVEKVCNETINPHNNTFHFAAIVSALNNFDLPANCTGVVKILALRKNGPAGDNFELETALMTAKDREIIKNKYHANLEAWISRD